MRLRYGYFITCTGVVKDDKGEVTEIHCTYDPATRGGNAPDGRKVKSTIHWVSAAHAIDAEVRNPHSLEILNGKLEPSLATAAVGNRIQFERMGYFCVDLDSAPGKLVFNRSVGLKDSWARIEKQAKGKK